MAHNYAVLALQMASNDPHDLAAPALQINSNPDDLAAPAPHMKSELDDLESRYLNNEIPPEYLGTAPTPTQPSQPSHRQTSSWVPDFSKIKLRLIASLSALTTQLWTAPTMVRGHKTTPSVDSGICIDDSPPSSPSQHETAAVTIPCCPPSPSPPPSISLFISPKTSRSPSPEVETDPMFSLGFTDVDHEHITAALNSGTFAFPFRNLAQEHEEINAFRRLEEQRHSTPLRPTSPAQLPLPASPFSCRTDDAPEDESATPEHVDQDDNDGAPWSTVPIHPLDVLPPLCTSLAPPHIAALQAEAAALEAKAATLRAALRREEQKVRMMTQRIWRRRLKADQTTLAADVQQAQARRRQLRDVEGRGAEVRLVLRRGGAAGCW